MNPPPKVSEALEQRLDKFLEQPGAILGGAERHFIVKMRESAQHGVGYGFMQQVIEWEWQSKSPGSHGPEYYERELSALREVVREAGTELDEALKSLQRLNRQVSTFGIATSIAQRLDALRAKLG